MAKSRKGLGKGINALFTDELKISESSKNDIETDDIDDITDDLKGKRIEEIRLIDIEPNPAQARKNFDEEKLNELADSIKNFGVLQPIILTKKDGYYQIVAGERRWRAAKLAGLETIPSIIREEEKKDNNKISLIENLQREDLNPVEKARGYRQMIDDYGYNITEVAKAVSKDRSTVSTSLNVLDLYDKTLDYVEKNGASERQCLELVKIDDPDLQYEVAVFMVEDGISANEARKRLNAVTKKPKKKEDIFLPIYKEVEDEFSQYFGTKVRLKATNKDATKGQIILKYNSNEDLERMLGKLKDF